MVNSKDSGENWRKMEEKQWGIYEKKYLWYNSFSNSQVGE